MTTTVTLQVPTLEDYDLKIKRIPVADLADFSAKNQQPESDNSDIVIYTYGAGDAADVLTIIAKRQYVEKRDISNMSIRVSALTKSVVTETGDTSYDPIEVVLAWNIPGKYSKDADFVVEMMSIAMSIFAQELTGANGNPTSLVVDQFDHNVLNLLTQ